MKLHIEFNSEEKEAVANYVNKIGEYFTEHFGMEMAACPVTPKTESLPFEQEGIGRLAEETREDGTVSFNCQICPNLVTGYLNLITKHFNNLVKALEIAVTAFQGMDCFEEFVHDMMRFMEKAVEKKAA